MNLKTLMLATICTLPCAVTRAGDATLTLPSFKSMERAATDSVNIDLGPWLLQMAGSFLDDKDSDDAATKKMLTGIKSIQVRSYEFAADFAYPSAEVDAIRQQLSAPGWKPLVQVHDGKKNENVDIYISMQDDRTQGFALIASEPRQFTVINIVGSIEMKDLPALEKHLHIPNVNFSPVAKL